MMKQRWGLDRNVLQPTPGDPRGAEQHHWNTGAKENQQLNSGGPSNRQKSSGRAFMPVLVTSNFEDDSIKNERASMETPFSHYKSTGNFLDAQEQLTPVVNGPIWPKFELVQDFMHVLVTCKYKKDQMKNNREKVETSFSTL